MTRRLLHTPGPWEYDGKFTVTIPHEDGMTAFRTNPADACLIAAAPDLFDGCNALLGLIQLICSREDIPNEIRDALETNHRRQEALDAVNKARYRP
jgi:hypothetical protein